MGRKNILFAMLFLLMTGAVPVCVVSETNAPDVTPSGGGQYVESLTSTSENILVYSDDANFADLEDRPPLVALRNLGYSYTAVGDGDYTTFISLLTTGGPWDLVVYNEENLGPPESVYDALYNYLTSNGKVIVTTWYMRYYPGKPLWTELGVSYAYTLSFDGNKVMYLWSPTHPIFTTPNAIPNPLTYNGDLYGIDGFFVYTLSGAHAIAGNTTTPQDGQAIIVVRDDGKAIFNGILTGCMNMDQDGDGKTEAVELWENEISFILGISPPVGGAIASSNSTPNTLILYIATLIAFTTLAISVAMVLKRQIHQ
jgi:hypothetical protein